jgi:hypothetical protein
MTPEAKVKKKIRELAASLGGQVFYCPQVMSGVTKLGTPDVLMCAHGLFVAVEVKASVKAKPSRAQLARMKEIRAAGGYALTVAEENFEDFDKALRELVEIGCLNRLDWFGK